MKDHIGIAEKLNRESILRSGGALLRSRPNCRIGIERESLRCTACGMLSEAALQPAALRTLRFHLDGHLRFRHSLRQRRMQIYICQPGSPVHQKIYLLPDTLMYHPGTEIPPIGHS